MKPQNKEWEISKNAPNWKGEIAGKEAKHKWLYTHYGSPKTCEFCKKDFVGRYRLDWAIKRGKEYSHNRNDYLRLCRSCHRKYDNTPEKIKKAIQNLHWYDKSLPILQLDKKTKKLIKEWRSAWLASEILKINNGNLVSTLKGRLKSCGGFTWRYL